MPRVSAVATAAMLSYIEGDVFRGSRHMPLEDVLTVLTEEAVAAIPGLPAGPGIAIRRALRKAKLELTPGQVTSPSAGIGSSTTPLLSPTGPAATSMVRRLSSLYSLGVETAELERALILQSTCVVAFM